LEITKETSSDNPLTKSLSNQSDKPELQKLIDPNVKELLLDENVRNNEDFSLVINKLTNYCVHDSIALANIIFKFSEIIYEEFKLNIHNYPTASSLAFSLII
jgi:DNA polymerase type B, organellar and viral